MKRVTGIGGIFFKTENPQKLADWYEKHLGIEFGGKPFYSFKWKDEGEDDGQTAFSLFPNDTEYFEPSENSLMLNFRVENLAALLEALKSEGVKIVGGEPATYEYGKFGWILDPTEIRSNSGSRLIQKFND